jgi:threonine aldolase
MRQVGILAAAGLHALDHHVDRLADDHRRARRLADLLAEAAPGAVDPATVETNIVVVESDVAADIVAACREQGVLLSLLDRRHLRAVTHLDVDDDDVEQAASVLGRLVRRQ